MGKGLEPHWLLYPVKVPAWLALSIGIYSAIGFVGHPVTLRIVNWLVEAVS